MELHTLSPKPRSRKDRKRVGRGPGSGSGKTAGRGHKGQLSRSGHTQRRNFEGGQMPLVRRLPKRGFTNTFRIEFQVVNLRDLERAFRDGDLVSPESLVDKGLVRKGAKPVKILGSGELTKKLNVKAHKFSTSAQSSI